MEQPEQAIPRLERFQYWRLAGDHLEPADKDHAQFSHWAAVTHYALRLMENKTGRKALCEVGITVCKAWYRNWEDQTGLPQVRHRDPGIFGLSIVEDMPLLVNLFLRKLRGGFFHLVLTDMPSHIQAGTFRPIQSPSHLATGNVGIEDYQYTGRASLDQLSSKFDPKHLCLIVFNEKHPVVKRLRFLPKFIINPDTSSSSDESDPGRRPAPSVRAENAEARAKRAKDAEAPKAAIKEFHQVVMYLSMVMCHEMAHAFVVFLGYIHGDPTRLTPPEATCYPASDLWSCEPEQAKPSQPGTTGEAGYIFESHAWDGLFVPVLPDSVDRAELGRGELWLQVTVKGSSEVKNRIVPYDVVQRFIYEPTSFDMALLRTGNLVNPRHIYLPVVNTSNQNLPVVNTSNQKTFQESTQSLPNSSKDRLSSFLEAIDKTPMFERAKQYTVHAIEIERFMKDPANQQVTPLTHAIEGGRL